MEMDRHIPTNGSQIQPIQIQEVSLKRIVIVPHLLLQFRQQEHCTIIVSLPTHRQVPVVQQLQTRQQSL